MSDPHLIIAHPSLFTALELDRFEREILSNPAVTEHECSEFFSQFPKFLFLGKGRKIEREVTLLATATGEEFRVDFFRQNYGAPFWDLIELKSPQKKVVIGAVSAHSAISADVHRAVSQAADYRDLIDADQDLRARLEKRGIRVYRPNILIVVGRENTLVAPERMQELYERIQRGAVEFKTYDDLYRFAKEHYEVRGVVVLPSDIIMPSERIVLKQGFLRGGNISQGYGDALEEALAVAIYMEDRNCPSLFRMSSWRGNIEVTVDLPPPSPAASSAWGRVQATEWGAAALSLGVLRLKLDLELVNRSRTGTGFDYWLGPKELARDNLALIKERLWPLEVSGLISPREGDIEMRLRSKTRQLQRVGLRQGLVSVVSFGARQIKVDRVDAHRGEEENA